MNVAIAVALAALLDLDLLVPTVHATDWVGLHWKGEVLVDATIGPPHALRIGI